MKSGQICMIVNPYLFLFVFYSTFSMLGSFFIFWNKGFAIAGQFYSVSVSSIVQVFFLNLIFLLYLLVCYFFSLSGKYRSRINFLGNTWGALLLIQQVLYLVFVKVTGAGMAGSGFSFGGFNVFNYYFIMLNPDILAFIIIPLLRSNFYSLICIFVLVASFLLRGWSGGFLFLIVFLLVRIYPRKINLTPFFVLLMILIVLFPLIDAFKWGIRLQYDFSQIISLAKQSYSTSNIIQVYERFVSRFYHINNTVFVVENLEYFKSSYGLSVFKDFWQNGILYETYCRVFDSCGMHFNRYIVTEFYDPNSFRPWDVDPGSSGWLAILGVSSVFYFLFFSLIFFTTYMLSLRYLGFKSVLVFYCFSLIYLYHGWLAPFLNVSFYYIIVAFIYRFSLAFKRPRFKA